MYYTPNKYFFKVEIMNRQFKVDDIKPLLKYIELDLLILLQCSSTYPYGKD